MIKKSILLITLFVAGLFSYGQNSDKAKALLDDLQKDLNEYFTMYNVLPEKKRKGVAMEVYQKLYTLRELYSRSRNAFPEEAQKMMEQFGEINAMVRQDL